MKQALTAVRDIKGMSRLVKGTTAQVQHQTSHMLGHVIVSVKVRHLSNMNLSVCVCASECARMCVCICVCV